LGVKAIVIPATNNAANTDFFIAYLLFCC